MYDCMIRSQLPPLLHNLVDDTGHGLIALGNGHVEFLI
jgi:hypothetical protein